MTYKGFNRDMEAAAQDGTEWVFGGLSEPALISVPPELRQIYLPLGEDQFGVEDFEDCATRGPVNILETIFNFGRGKLQNNQWLYQNGYVDEHGAVTFSDRFVAINSGTTSVGNSIKAPLEAIRKQGLIPKKMLPANSAMTFEQYINPNAITDEMRALGLEFARRFGIAYEQVLNIHFADAVKDDMLTVALCGYPAPVNGEYPRIEGQFTHVVDLFDLPEWYIFDNYVDSVDGDYIKKLAPDYIFYDYGYRVYLAKESNLAAQIPLLQLLVQKLKALLALLHA